MGTTFLARLNSRLSGAVRLLALTVAMACAVPAGASVTPMSIEAMATVAEDVVHGTVEKQRQEVYNSIPMTVSTIRVTERLKGTSTAAEGKAETVDVVTIGGRTSYYGVQSNATVPMDQGQEVVVFLSNPGRRRLNSYGPAAADAQSPMVKYPQVVGGFQGKFDVVRTEANAGQPATARVLRPTPGRRLGSAEALPALDVFKTQVRQVTSGAVPPGPATLRTLPNAAPVAIPEQRPELTALRFFDPPTNAPRVVEAPPPAVPAPSGS